MSELLIKYVVVLDNSETWLQMADKVEDCIQNDGTPSHIERWFYSRHDKGDSLMLKEKAGDKLPLIIKMSGLPSLADILWHRQAEINSEAALSNDSCVR